jgi:hypothetical protein
VHTRRCVALRFPQDAATLFQAFENGGLRFTNPMSWGAKSLMRFGDLICFPYPLEQ